MKFGVLSGSSDAMARTFSHQSLVLLITLGILHKKKTADDAHYLQHTILSYRKLVYTLLRSSLAEMFRSNVGTPFSKSLV